VAAEDMGLLEGFAVLLPSSLYGLFGVLFWGLVEARGRQAKKADDELRKSRDEKARSSQPSAPLLQHRISHVPEAPIGAAAAVGPSGPAPIEPALDAGPHRDAMGLAPPPDAAGESPPAEGNGAPGAAETPPADREPEGGGS
jgi:hypothetical protein